MKNKLLFALITILCIFGLISLIDKKSDAYVFKREYEKLNGAYINDTKVRSIVIDKRNPFIYKNASDINKMINDKKTFVIYFGFAKCPWCRSVVPSLIEAAKSEGLKKIYYVVIYDIRDVLKIDKKGNLITEKKGTDDYYTLLTYLNDVLDEYILVDNSGKKIKTNEKRIYAPNVVSVVGGKATKITTGISRKQSDPYMKLTHDMKKEMYNEFIDVIKTVTENKKQCKEEKQC